MNELNKNIFNEEIKYQPNITITKEEQKGEILINLEDSNIDNRSDATDTIISRYDSDNLKTDKTLITLAKEKDEKYDINSKEIFFNINEMRKKLKSLEDQFIDFKKGLINHLKL